MKIKQLIELKEITAEIEDLILKETRLYAFEAHKTQLYGNRPYIFHLDDVANIVKSYGFIAQIIAYLHDIIEDTNITQYNLDEEFGYIIGNNVEFITDLSGSNRRERKEKTYKRMKENRNPMLRTALIVKTADRLSNVQNSIDFDNFSLLQMYKKEHEAFKNAVYRYNLCNDLWIKLNQAVGK